MPDSASIGALCVRLGELSGKLEQFITLDRDRIQLQEKRMDQQTSDIKAMDTRLDALTSRVMYALGIGAAVIFILQVGLPILARFFGAH